MKRKLTIELTDDEWFALLDSNSSNMGMYADRDGGIARNIAWAAFEDSVLQSLELELLSPNSRTRNVAVAMAKTQKPIEVKNIFGRVVRKQ